MNDPSKGNTFANTCKIPPELVNEVSAVITKHLDKAGLRHVLVGSAVCPRAPVNDIDIQVELSDAINQFKVSDPKDARTAVKKYFSDLGFETASSGINIFVCVDYKSIRYQVDLEIVYNIDAIKHFHIHAIPNNSPYKGVHKHLMLALLSKKKGYLYSAWEGLYNRTETNKKGTFITNNYDEVAHILLGKYGSKHINCVENILRYMPHAEATALLAEAEQDKNWKL